MAGNTRPGQDVVFPGPRLNTGDQGKRLATADNAVPYEVRSTYVMQAVQHFSDSTPY